MIDRFMLISGASYDCDDVTVYPPQLRDIRDVGYEKYRMFLSIFLMTKEDICKMIELDPSSDGVKAIDVLQLITLLPEFRESLVESLSFFLRSNVVYDNEIGYVLVETNSVISFSHIWKIRAAILKFCRVDDDSEENVTFRNDRARKTWEKIQKHKAEMRKQKASGGGDKNMELPNLIGAVCAYSPSYNLLNIWDLTVYQFYDQFARLDNKIQIEVYGQRWAAWGKEDFDFSIWRKALDKS